MRIFSFRLTAVLLLLLAAAGASTPGALGQQESTPATQRPALRNVVYDGDMASLLQHLAEEFGVTIGLETDPQQVKPKVKFEVRDATFNDVLDAIVRAQPAYKWEWGEGTVDVYPLAGGSPLLDTVVGSFEVSDADWDGASNILMSLPEMQSSMSAMMMSRREAGRGSAGRSGNVFSLRVENVTARKALHEMAKKSGTRFWVFRRLGGREKFFSLRNSAR